MGFILADLDRLEVCIQVGRSCCFRKIFEFLVLHSCPLLHIATTYKYVRLPAGIQSTEPPEEGGIDCHRAAHDRFGYRPLTQNLCFA